MIKAWIARDSKNGTLGLCTQKPFRGNGIWQISDSARYCELDQDFFSFPIEWEDEPMQVEIMLKEVAE